jgi:hypothetical protein
VNNVDWPFRVTKQPRCSDVATRDRQLGGPDTDMWALPMDGSARRPPAPGSGIDGDEPRTFVPRSAVAVGACDSSVGFLWAPDARRHVLPHPAGFLAGRLLLSYFVFSFLFV